MFYIIPLHFIPHLYIGKMAVRKVCFSVIFFLPTAFRNLAQIIIPFTYLPRILKNRGTFGALFTICSYDFVYTHKSACRFLRTMTKMLVKSLFIPYRIFTRQYYSRSRVQGCKTGSNSIKEGMIAAIGRTGGRTHFLYGKLFCNECVEPVILRSLNGSKGKKHKVLTYKYRYLGHKGNGCMCRNIDGNCLLFLICRCWKIEH